MGIEWPHETIKQRSPSFTPPKNDLERFIGSLIQNMPRGFQLGKSDVSLGICNVSALNTDPVFKRFLMVQSCLLPPKSRGKGTLRVALGTVVSFPLHQQTHCPSLL